MDVREASLAPMMTCSFLNFSDNNDVIYSPLLLVFFCHYAVKKWMFPQLLRLPPHAMLSRTSLPGIAPQKTRPFKRPSSPGSTQWSNLGYVDLFLSSCLNCPQDVTWDGKGAFPSKAVTSKRHWIKLAHELATTFGFTFNAGFLKHQGREVFTVS